MELDFIFKILIRVIDLMKKSQNELKEKKYKVELRYIE